MSRSAREIITEAEALLQTAKFGLEDMRTRPGRGKTGLRNAVVFGRNTTWALQNLRSVAPDFEPWYAEKQDAMRADPLLRYFASLRTQIEKQAQTPTTISVYIRSFRSGDMRRFEPPPPGATSFFIGDQNGGTGWLVPKPDGTEEKYYVELPPDIGDVNLHLPDAPKSGTASTTSAIELVNEYLAKIEALVREARQKFRK